MRYRRSHRANYGSGRQNHRGGVKDRSEQRCV